MHMPQNFKFILGLLAVVVLSSGIARADSDDDAYTCADDKQELCSVMPSDLSEKRSETSLQAASLEASVEESAETLAEDLAVAPPVNMAVTSSAKLKMVSNAELHGASLGRMNLKKESSTLLEAEEIQTGTGGPGGLIAVEEANKVRERIRQIEILLSNISKTGIEPGRVVVSSKN
jgi:hypothetical protein